MTPFELASLVAAIILTGCLASAVALAAICREPTPTRVRRVRLPRDYDTHVWVGTDPRPAGRDPRARLTTKGARHG